MARSVVAAILIAMALGGCASVRTGSLCTVGPIVPSAEFESRWTRSEKEQIVTYNESGAAICGWKP